MVESIRLAYFHLQIKMVSIECLNRKRDKILKNSAKNTPIDLTRRIHQNLIRIIILINLTTENF